jgi:hypothetical protein
MASPTPWATAKGPEATRLVTCGLDHGSVVSVWWRCNSLVVGAIERDHNCIESRTGRANPLAARDGRKRTAVLEIAADAFWREHENVAQETNDGRMTDMALRIEIARDGKSEPAARRTRA